MSENFTYGRFTFSEPIGVEELAHLLECNPTMGLNTTRLQEILRPSDD